MHHPASRCLRNFSGLILLLTGTVLFAGCAFSERGPDSQSFVHQVRRVLGESPQREVTISQLVGPRWQQVCMHRDGSLSVSLIEMETRHVLRVPFAQLSVVDAAGADSLDGKCLQRADRIRLRRTGKELDAAIVLERVNEPDTITQTAMAE